MEKQTIIELFLFELRKKDLASIDQLKKILVLFIEKQDEEIVDVLLWGLVKTLNKKKYKEAKLIYYTLSKLKPGLFEPFMDDIKKIFIKTYKAVLDPQVFVKLILEYEPYWLYQYLAKNRGNLDSYLSHISEELEHQLEQLERLSTDIDHLIGKNIKFSALNYKFTNYLEYL